LTKKFEATKVVIRSRKSKKEQTTQWPKDKRKNNELRNHKIEQHEPHWNRDEFMCSRGV